MSTPVEPSADLRIFSSFLRQMYVALVADGFTPQEAMTIIGQTIAANMGGDK